MIILKFIVRALHYYFKSYTFLYYSHGKKRDIELRTKIYAAGKRKLKKHVCGDVKLDAMFIDARTMEEDLPWDETDDFKSGGITKNTPL